MRLIVVGTGAMAKSQTNHFKAIDGVEIVAAVDTDPVRLAEFADHFDIQKRFFTLEEAIAWGGFDAATNVTPDRMHHATSLALIAAGNTPATGAIEPSSPSSPSTVKPAMASGGTAPMAAISPSAIGRS